APDGEVLVPDGNGGTLESPSATGGVIRGSANKAYLTPIEQPPPGNQAGLSLAFGPVHDLEVLDTPVGRLAIVISKDAWMIDVNDRFLAKGANVVLQPEAFSEWAYAAAPWQPDIFKEGGFANLEKNVPWVADVVADADLPPGATTAPADPPPAPPPRFSAAVRVSGAEPLPVAQHAPRVAARGGRVYVVWHEARAGLENVFLAVSRNRGRSFAPPIRVSDHPAGAVAELNPAIAVRGGRVFVVWQEFAAGRNDDAGRITLARFDPRGTKRGPDVRVDDHDGGGKWVPAIALVGHDPVVAWVDERDAGLGGEPVEHIYAARGHDSGLTFDPAVRVDAGATDPLAAHLDNKWGPTLATARNTVYAAWADFRRYNWDIFL